MYCEEISDLPIIPSHLIKDLKTIESYKDLFLKKTNKYSGSYSSYESNTDLSDYIQQFFDHQVLVRYQVIKKSLPVHVDKANVSNKLNYIIDPGGDVKTRWWSSVEEPRKIISEYKQLINRWYRLDIHTPHDISMPTNPRISITVRKKV